MARKLAPAAGGRNSKRSLRGARAQRKYGTTTPSDAEIKAKEVAARAKRFATARAAGKQTVRGKKVTPKSPTSASQPSKQTQPKKQKKGDLPKKKEKPTFDKYLSQQTPTNARNALENAGGRSSSSSTVSNRDSYSGSRYKKSLDQALYNLTSVMKQDEVQQECRLWKAELNDTFNNLLDNYQDLYKGTYEDDKFNKEQGKDKRKPITNTGRSGKGSLGSDSATPALGTTVRDMKVMKNLFLEIIKDSYEDNKFNMEQGKGKKPKITNTGRSGKGSLGSDSHTPLGMSDDDKNVMQS